MFVCQAALDALFLLNSIFIALSAFLPQNTPFFFFMPADKPPVFGACKRLDIELEMVRWAFFSLPL